MVSLSDVGAYGVRLVGAGGEGAVMAFEQRHKSYRRQSSFAGRTLALRNNGRLRDRRGCFKNALGKPLYLSWPTLGNRM